MTTEFGNDMYVARYYESNKQTYVSDVKRSDKYVKFSFYATASSCTFEVTFNKNVLTVEDGCEKLVFESPSGKTVVCYADNRLYDNKYLKTHKIDGVE